MNHDIEYKTRYLEKDNGDDYRSPYFRDRSRLVHSAAFRRLQGKTQVLGLGESDFYRSRLTHSMEVASLSQSIAKYLEFNKDNLQLIDSDNINSLFEDDYSQLLEAIGLAHDIGHPPFGHGGERALHQCMWKYGGFEGNAQTLRILTTLAEYHESYGLNPSLRLALGVLKYPISFSDAKIEIKSDDVIPTHPPKCCYGDDLATLKKFILENNILTEDEWNDFVTNEIKDRYKKSIYKTFDCAIMEIADDISYSVHDLEDSCALKLLQKSDFDSKELEVLFSKFPSNNQDKIHSHGSSEDFISQLTSGTNKERKRCVNTLIYLMIDSVKVKVNERFKDPLFRFNPYLEEYADDLRVFFFNQVKDKVIKSPEVQHLEYKGEMIVKKLFETLNSDNNERLLDRRHVEKLNNKLDEILREKDIDEVAARKDDDYLAFKARLVCDYISGMTDSYATKLFTRLFTPKSGSVFDRL
ncbi:TPA: anti-phage deoxyguanosine triphosphatase [Photobacterium damselae]